MSHDMLHSKLDVSSTVGRMKKEAKTLQLETENLPDSIMINHVLSKLHLKDLVTLSLVSKRWNSMVWQVPSLSVDGSVLFIQQLAFQMQCLKILNLVVTEISRSYDTLMCGLAFLCRHLETLQCTLSPSRDSSSMSMHLFARFKKLKMLKIDMAEMSTEILPIQLDAKSLKFRTLKYLIMGSIRISDSTLHSLLECCPVLESLKLVDVCYTGLNMPQIVSASLKYLGISRNSYSDDEADQSGIEGVHTIEHLELTHAPSLRTLEVDDVKKLSVKHAPQLTALTTMTYNVMDISLLPQNCGALADFSIIGISDKENPSWSWSSLRKNIHAFSRSLENVKLDLNFRDPPTIAELVSILCNCKSVDLFLYPDFCTPTSLETFCSGNKKGVNWKNMTLRFSNADWRSASVLRYVSYVIIDGLDFLHVCLGELERNEAQISGEFLQVAFDICNKHKGKCRFTSFRGVAKLA